jgi:hypothetical protein
MIYATAIARVLYERQEKMLVSFLHAPADRSLITGDQPIINTRSTPEMPSTDGELYYPLGPKLGMLLSTDTLSPTSRQVQLSASDVESYNRLIVGARYRQLYAASSQDLAGL